MSPTCGETLPAWNAMRVATAGYSCHSRCAINTQFCPFHGLFMCTLKAKMPEPDMGWKNSELGMPLAFRSSPAAISGDREAEVFPQWIGNSDAPLLEVQSWPCTRPG